MNESKYFPPLYGDVRCDLCEKEDCHSREKYQRSKRDFSVLSGRCPRLPDLSGNVDPADEEAHYKEFPILIVDRRGADTKLSIKIPGGEKEKPVFVSKRYREIYYKNRYTDGSNVKYIIRLYEVSYNDLIGDAQRIQSKGIRLYRAILTGETL